MKKPVNFNAQHSPMGAFMSFTCGNFFAGGGTGIEIGRPVDQQIYIGVKKGHRQSKEPLHCLPFYKKKQQAGVSASDFQVAQDNSQPPERYENVVAYSEDQINRDYEWATDQWTTEDFKFTIYSPFDSIPEPGVADSEKIKKALLPAIVATLKLDNRKGSETKTAVFAVKYPQQGVREINTENGACGFGWGRNQGFYCQAKSESSTASCKLTPFQKWSVTDGLLTTGQPVHALGTIAGVSLEVPAGEVCELTIAIGVYHDGIVTTGMEGRYLYTKYYRSLEDVLATAMLRAPELIAQSEELDQQLRSSNLTNSQRFLISHSTRSYYGSTQLLEIDGKPFFVVNEGEYCMMNTLDLSVDQQFWELDHNPWVVRNLLDNFVLRYSYLDELQGPSGEKLEGGLTFTHDMGVNNHFSPAGWSSYELPRLKGCFSYMSAEQLCNWILMSCCYVAKTGDQKWLNQNLTTISACLQSLCKRGGHSGFTQLDSSRCEGGQEITTYDSLDHSLAQTRNNVYMAVKCWACYIGLEQLGEIAGRTDIASLAQKQSIKSAVAIAGHLGADGIFPAVFEPDSPGHPSRILPAAEGLIYLLYWQAAGWKDVMENQKKQPAGQKLLHAIKTHTLTLLNDPECRNFFKDGGIRLSSTSDNSWMSKIAIFQHIAREWLDTDDNIALREKFAKADEAHMNWQINGSAFWACSDQMVNGVAKGSRYYPRIITTALWMDGKCS